MTLASSRQQMGDVLRRVREEAKLTRAQVVRRLYPGRSPRWLTHIEEGDRTITMNVFFALCTILSVNPAAVLLQAGLITHNRLEECIP